MAFINGNKKLLADIIEFCVIYLIKFRFSEINWTFLLLIWSIDQYLLFFIFNTGNTHSHLLPHSPHDGQTYNPSAPDQLYKMSFNIISTFATLDLSVAAWMVTSCSYNFLFIVVFFFFLCHKLIGPVKLCFW